MRERSQTTPRRRGPKMPVPRSSNYEQQPFDPYAESPYYSIDNTEDIYGTTLLPSQRCYVDPWDLENYDYVRKKLESTPSPTNAYYDTSMSPSPPRELTYKHDYMQTNEQLYGYAPSPPRMAATMPRKNRRRSHYQCELPCCLPQNVGANYYGMAQSNKYDDYMAQMTQQLHISDEMEQHNLYNGYGGFSSASSSEPHSSIGEDALIYGRRPQQQHTLTRASNTRTTPTYEYCNPYATLPYCSVSDCYECLAHAQQCAMPSLIYAAPSLYNSAGYQSGSAGSSSTMGRGGSSSLYSGIYAHKFGMSKKGLLQIDYSCSWNDLDRVIRRNY